MTKVLITGSAGFIASHVVEECLNRGWEVTCIDIKEEKNKKNNVNYIVKDLRLLKNNEINEIKKLNNSAMTAKKHGMGTRINLIIGFPDETWKDVFQTLLYGLKMAIRGVDEVPIYLFSP